MICTRAERQRSYTSLGAGSSRAIVSSNHSPPGAGGTKPIVIGRPLRRPLTAPPTSRAGRGKADPYLHTIN